MQNSIEKTAANNTKLLYSYDKYGKIKGEITEENAYTYYRGTELIGYTSNSGDRLYYVQDGHGNVTALLNEDGTERPTTITHTVKRKNKYFTQWEVKQQ